jgi:hypothetical protein
MGDVRVQESLRLGIRCRVWGISCRVKGLWYRVKSEEGFGFRV